MYQCKLQIMIFSRDSMLAEVMRRLCRWNIFHIQLRKQGNFRLSGLLAAMWLSGTWAAASFRQGCVHIAGRMRFLCTVGSGG